MLILGRSPNLILGALTAVFNVVVAFHVLGFAPTVEQIGVVNVAFGALVVLVANDVGTQIKAGAAAQVRSDNGKPPSSSGGGR